MAIMIFSFLIFTITVGLLTWLLTRHDNHQSEDGFFLGGRSLAFPFIAGSLLLTNLSTEQLVGLNGAAFSDGLCVMVWEIIAVTGLVFMALFFLPVFLRGGITTVPQYLETRFDSQTRTITNLVFLVAYAIILLPIILYTGATGMIEILDLKTLFHVESETHLLYLIVISVGLIGSIYALFGGLRSVAVSDTLNGIGLLIGGFLILFFALKQIAGDHGSIIDGYHTIRTALPEQFNSIGGPNSSVPFFTMFSGIMCLNVFYWCTNQQIIQRTFGAKSLAEGQKGILLTGMLKLFGPLYLVLPGILALYLFRDTVKPDHAYGKLVNLVLPHHLTGFFAAVVMGAILSSFNSALNSACTLFSLGVYKPFIKKEASELDVVRASKIFGWVIAAIAIAVAPLLAGQASIFSYLQKMNGLYFIPILSVVVVGIVSRRVPAAAAKFGLAFSFLLLAAGYFIPLGTAANGTRVYFTDYIHNLHFLGGVFAYTVIIMLVWGNLRPRKTEFIQQDVQAVDMTPWKYAIPAGITLIMIVLAIYAHFADFSILLNPQP